MDDERIVTEIRKLVGAQTRLVNVTSPELMLAFAKHLSPEFKVQLIEAMGFTPIGSDHDPDCVAPHGRGIRCNCVPPATSWGPPKDVAEFRKETWEDRLALAHKWTQEKSHGRTD